MVFEVAAVSAAICFDGPLAPRLGRLRMPTPSRLRLVAEFVTGCAVILRACDAIGLAAAAAEYSDLAEIRKNPAIDDVEAVTQWASEVLKTVRELR